MSIARRNLSPRPLFAAALILLSFTAVTRATVLIFDKGPTQFAFPDKMYGTPSATEFPDYGDNVTLADLIGGQDASAVRSQAPGTTVFHYGAGGGPTPDVTVD